MFIGISHATSQPEGDFFFFLEHIIANNAQNPFPLKPQFGAIFVFGSLEGPTLRAEIVHVSSFV